MSGVVCWLALLEVGYGGGGEVEVGLDDVVVSKLKGCLVTHLDLLSYNILASSPRAVEASFARPAPPEKSERESTIT